MTTTSTYNRTASWIGFALLGMTALVGCGRNTNASDESDIGTAVEDLKAANTTTRSPKSKPALAPTPAPTPAPEPSAEMRFAATRVNPTWATSFVLFDTAQIEIAIDLKDFASGTHSLRMDITGSDNNLYTAVNDSFDPANTSTCDEIVDGACRIWWTLQVRGTPIEWYDMLGNWPVALTVDSASAPLKNATFSLN
jgi:hypothetical protein